MGIRMCRLLVGLILMILVSQPALAELRDYSFNSGYLSSTTGERDTTYTDFVVKPEPAPLGPSFNDRVFNPQLTKEFQDKYNQQFGYTQADQVYNSPNRYSYYNDVTAQSENSQTDYQARQQYGQYVLRRLLEYHVDNYAKSDPSVRPLWEAKERVSKMNVEVQKVKVDIQYDIAGNTLDLKFTNPWLDVAKVRMQMQPGALGPAPVQEVIYSIAKQVTPVYRLESYFYQINGVISLIGLHPIMPHLSATLTLSTFTTTGPATTTPRESLYLAGLSYSF
jgi:hypothetical protein